MFARLGALGTLLAFPLLCLFCIPNKSAAIASLLETGVDGSIKSARINGVGVRADGRDMILTGNVANDEIKKNAGRLALAVSGVRSVENRLVVVGAPAILNEQIKSILIDRKIEFETGKDILLPASIPVLNDVLAVLKQYPGLYMEIAGHTDNAGTTAANRQLSLARAHAVAKWFEAHGIPGGHMKTEGFGSDRPLVPNISPETMAKNRRVEITTAN